MIEGNSIITVKTLLACTFPRYLFDFFLAIYFYLRNQVICYTESYMITSLLTASPCYSSHVLMFMNTCKNIEEENFIAGVMYFHQKAHCFGEY